MYFTRRAMYCCKLTCSCKTPSGNTSLSLPLLVNSNAQSCPEPNRTGEGPVRWFPPWPQTPPCRQHCRVISLPFPGLLRESLHLPVYNMYTLPQLLPPLIKCILNYQESHTPSLGPQGSKAEDVKLCSLLPPGGAMQQYLKKQQPKNLPGLVRQVGVFVFNKDNKTIGLDVGQGRVGLVPYHLVYVYHSPFINPVSSGTNTLCFIKETIYISFTFNRKFTAYPKFKIS